MLVSKFWANFPAYNELTAPNHLTSMPMYWYVYINLLPMYNPIHVYLASKQLIFSC